MMDLLCFPMISGAKDLQEVGHHRAGAIWPTGSWHDVKSMARTWLWSSMCVRGCRVVQRTMTIMVVTASILFLGMLPPSLIDKGKCSAVWQFPLQFFVESSRVAAIVYAASLGIFLAVAAVARERRCQRRLNLALHQVGVLSARIAALERLLAGTFDARFEACATCNGLWDLQVTGSSPSLDFLLGFPMAGCLLSSAVCKFDRSRFCDFVGHAIKGCPVSLLNVVLESKGGNTMLAELYLVPEVTGEICLAAIKLVNSSNGHQIHDSSASLLVSSLDEAGVSIVDISQQVNTVPWELCADHQSHCGASEHAVAFQPPPEVCSLSDGGDCLPFDALVWVEGQALPQCVCDVQTGQKVLCHDNIVGNLKFVSLLQAETKANSEIEWVRVTLADGTTMRMTSDHLMLSQAHQKEGLDFGVVDTGPVRAADLKPGIDSVMVLRVMPVDVENVEAGLKSDDCGTQRTSIVVQQPERHSIFVASSGPCPLNRCMAVGSSSLWACSSQPESAGGELKVACNGTCIIRTQRDSSQIMPPASPAAPAQIQEEQHVEKKEAPQQQRRQQQKQKQPGQQQELPQPPLAAAISQQSTWYPSENSIQQWQDRHASNSSSMHSWQQSGLQQHLNLQRMQEGDWHSQYNDVKPSPGSDLEAGPEAESASNGGNSPSNSSSCASSSTGVHICVGGPLVLKCDGAGVAEGAVTNDAVTSICVSDLLKIRAAGWKSLGSLEHARGDCRICVFESRAQCMATKRCFKGLLCERCHEPHDWVGAARASRLRLRQSHKRRRAARDQGGSAEADIWPEGLVAVMNDLQSSADAPDLWEFRDTAGPKRG